MPVTHCAPESTPLPAGALDVPTVQPGNPLMSPVITAQTGGSARGVAVLIHGLSNYISDWTTGTFLTLANDLRANGWQTIAIAGLADWGSEPTLINGDFTTDPASPNGPRFANRLALYWDHIAALLIKTNAGARPVLLIGSSLGAYTALQLALRRGGEFIGVAANKPVTTMSDVMSDGTRSFPAAACPGGADFSVTAINGLTIPVWISDGPGTTVLAISGFAPNGNGHPAIAGTACDTIYFAAYNATNNPGAVVPITANSIGTHTLFVASVPWDIQSGQGIYCVHGGGAETQTFTANGLQSMATVAGNGYILVNESILNAYGGVGTDYALPDFCADPGEVFATLDDEVNFNGQLCCLINTPITYGDISANVNADPEGDALNPLYNFPASGVNLAAAGDQTVGWTRTKKMCANAIAAGVPLTTYAPANEAHGLSAGDVTALMAWVTGTINPDYPRAF